jgi:transketolase
MDNKSHHVYSIIGDGECNEGSIWEMMLFANHFKLSNFTVIIDCNRFQALGLCEDTLENNNLAEKWKLFGWSVSETDGHDHIALKNAFLNKSSKKPNCIIANTVKGKGVSFMENNILWHYRDPQGEAYEQAKKELEACLL